MATTNLHPSTMTTMQQNPPRKHGLYLDDDDSSSDDDHSRNSTAPPKEVNDDDAAIAAQYNQTNDTSSKKRRKVERPKITLERLMDPEKGLLRVITHIPRAVQPVLSKMKTAMETTSDNSISRADIDVASQYLTTVLQSYQDIVMNDWLSLPSSGSIQDPTQKAVLQELLHKIDSLGGKSQMKEHLSSLRIECGRNPYLQRKLSPEKMTQLLQQFEQYTASQQHSSEQLDEEGPHEAEQSQPAPTTERDDDEEKAVAPVEHMTEREAINEVAMNDLPNTPRTNVAPANPPKRRFILEDSDEED